MLFCPKFRKLRLKLIRNISEIDASIYNILHCSRFTYMMNNQNVEIIKLVMDFLLKAYTDRALIHGSYGYLDNRETGKSFKNRPDMEKDGNLIKNTQTGKKTGELRLCSFITIFPAENHNDMKHS